MSLARQKAAAKERDARIIKALQRGESEEHIANVEGIGPQTVKKLRRGLPLLKNGTSPAKPYGLTDETNTFRSNLGNRVNDLKSRGLVQAEIGRMIGVPPHSQTAARTKPGLHDWKLSQIERLAEEEGMTWLELILKESMPAMRGFNLVQLAQSKEKWNSMIKRFLIG